MIIQEAARLSSVKEYYFSTKLKQLRSFKEAGRDIINLGIGNPDLPPSEATINKLIDTVSDLSNHGYQGYVGLPELRESMSLWYRRMYSVSLNASTEVLPLIGSKEGIMHVSMAFLNPGDSVLVPNPGYPTYQSVSNLVQANTIAYPLKEDKDWEPDFEWLESQDLSNAKIWWVNYPNMPTGAPASLDLFERIVTFAKKHELLVVNDNPYSLILHKTPRSIFQVEGAKDVALEFNSLSKSHNMAGWRVGMCVGRADYLQSILKVKSNVDTGMFKGVQLAAAEALNNSDTWHKEMNDKYRERRVLCEEILTMLGCTINQNQAGMFVWGKLSDRIKSTEEYVDDILSKTDVFVTPGFIFGSGGDRYLRISLCSHEDVLKESIRRIKNKFISE